MTVTREVPATEIVLPDNSAWLPLDDIFNLLSQGTLWAHGLPRDAFDQSIINSFCFAAYRLGGDGSHGELIGFARVITNRVTFAYLCDVFVLPALRGRGISHASMDFLRKHPDLQTPCRIVFVTTDADRPYRKCGFADVPEGVGFMQLHWPNIYIAASA